MDSRKIIDIEDIKLLVDSFYTKVREDQLLSPIFDGVIGDNWPKHLDKMYRFWQTLLLSEHTYNGSPFLPHAQMPLKKEHFNRWMELFTETIYDHFAGEKATEALWRANKMAEMFHYKIQYYQKHVAETVQY